MLFCKLIPENEWDIVIYCIIISIMECDLVMDFVTSCVQKLKSTLDRKINEMAIFSRLYSSASSK